MMMVIDITEKGKNKMPIYIDAEEAIQLIKAKNIPMFWYIKQDAIDCIESTPTAEKGR